MMFFRTFFFLIGVGQSKDASHVPCLAVNVPKTPTIKKFLTKHRFLTFPTFTLPDSFLCFLPLPLPSCLKTQPHPSTQPAPHHSSKNSPTLGGPGGLRARGRPPGLRRLPGPGALQRRGGAGVARGAAALPGRYVIGRGGALERKPNGLKSQQNQFLKINFG